MIRSIREFGEEVESFQMLTSVTPLLLWKEQPWLGPRRVYGPASGIWEPRFLGSATNSCLVPQQGLPSNSTSWSSPALPILPENIQYWKYWKYWAVINWDMPVVDLLCSREPTELRVLSSANSVKTEQGKRSTFVIAQIYNNSTPASGIVVLEPRGRFLIQHQWIYCIFDLFTRCLILQELILAFCTWDWFFNNLYPFHIN